MYSTPSGHVIINELDRSKVTFPKFGNKNVRGGYEAIEYKQFTSLDGVDSAMLHFDLNSFVGHMMYFYIPFDTLWKPITNGEIGLFICEHDKEWYVMCCKIQNGEVSFQLGTLSAECGVQVEDPNIGTAWVRLKEEKRKMEDRLFTIPKRVRVGVDDFWIEHEIQIGF
jgi:hypothetical protein